MQIFISSSEEDEITDEYSPCSIAVVPSDGNETEFVYDASSKIKIRGNSTALATKKPYNIKFSSKKDLCGMGKAKKWALVANAYDKALIRNKIALDLGLDMGVSYTSSSVFVELWVDGEFKGNYQLVENVDVSKSRVDIDVDSGDFLIELEANRSELGTTYVETSEYGIRFAVNEPEDVDGKIIEKQLDAFEDALASGDWSKVTAIADVKSFVNFYIMSEFVKQVDFNFSSTRFYMKDGILYTGPGWDYDLSMGNVGARVYDDYKLYNNFGSGTNSNNSWEGLWCTKLKWFEVLMTYPEFRAMVKERFEEVSPILRNVFEANSLGESKIDALLSVYGNSFERNYETWSITEDDVADSLAVARTPDATFSENVEYLREWLENRYEYLSEVFSAY